MSWLNVAETFYTLAKRNSPEVAEAFLIRLQSLPIRNILSDEDGIMLAARIKARHPTAFHDSLAIAPADVKQTSMITGEQDRLSKVRYNCPAATSKNRNVS